MHLGGDRSRKRSRWSVSSTACRSTGSRARAGVAPRQPSVARAAASDTRTAREMPRLAAAAVPISVRHVSMAVINRPLRPRAVSGGSPGVRATFFWNAMIASAFFSFRTAGRSPAPASSRADPPPSAFGPRFRARTLLGRPPRAAAARWTAARSTAPHAAAARRSPRSPAGFGHPHDLEPVLRREPTPLRLRDHLWVRGPSPAAPSPELRSPYGLPPFPAASFISPPSLDPFILASPPLH